jgi:hypothetical protein
MAVDGWQEPVCFALIPILIVAEYPNFLSAAPARFALIPILIVAE